jgi:Ca2+ transporting ATPase
MAIAIVCGFIISESPINAIQMLWINVIMDSFSALALATEPPTDELLDRAPVKKRDPIITRTMWNAVCFQAICQFILLILILFLSPGILGIQSTIHMEEYSAERAVHYTFFFNCFVYLQVFNFINARVLKKSETNPFHNICSNPIFWLIIALTVVGQTIFIEAFGKPVRCTHLPLKLHLISMSIGAFALLFAYIEKLIPDTMLPFPMIIKEKEEVDRDSVSKGLMAMTHSGIYRVNRSGIIN